MTPHEAAVHFFLTGTIPTGIEDVHYSKNRAEAIARLGGYLNYCTKQGADSDVTSLIVSLIGELTNNCFDHNLGYWIDVPGCCASLTFEKGVLTFCVADRGRGIVETLRPVAGAKLSSKEIISMAFEKVITGRAPENRGNGLKYVRRFILSGDNSLKCFSNDVVYQIGTPVSPVIDSLPKPQRFGTLIYFQWRVL